MDTGNESINNLEPNSLRTLRRLTLRRMSSTPTPVPRSRRSPTVTDLAGLGASRDRDAFQLRAAGSRPTSETESLHRHHHLQGLLQCVHGAGILLMSCPPSGKKDPRTAHMSGNCCAGIFCTPNALARSRSQVRVLQTCAAPRLQQLESAAAETIRSNPNGQKQCTAGAALW
ncbi:hypothetical protein Hypma_011837 [Hypsizygus marmoreus]|uniref:Uncharacterized protein n=1 Tax=Hypsizygus marmoreus TaxID=39966 RepID=A0A369JIH5_HYPMA|nr:hypothetical protein Hypma_011837 [Hypsizygus marmoreus]